MRRYDFIFVVVRCLLISSKTYPQEADGPNSARKELKSVACFMGYPNAMLFHTAFHGGNTTRFTLLKMAMDSEGLSEKSTKSLAKLIESKA